MSNIVEILLILILMVLVVLTFIQLVSLVAAAWLRLSNWLRLSKSKPGSEVRVAKAMVASTLGKHIVVDEGSMVYVLGYDLGLFREKQYHKLYELLDLWLSRGAHIIYFLHIAPQSDDIAKIQEVFESSTSQIRPTVKGSIRLVVIEENPETEEILEKSKTNHFLLVNSNQNFTGDGGDKYQLWLEGNHPINKTVAENCIYLANANRDSRLKPVRYAIELFLRIGNHSSQLALGNTPELHKLRV